MAAKPSILSGLLRRKFATVLLVSVSAVTAFATLGDGGAKNKKSSLLANRYSSITPGKFSLKSGYQYRGSQIISQENTNNTITLNSVITYQKGNTTYIVPLKTKINTKVSVSLGIPSLNK